MGSVSSPLKWHGGKHYLASKIIGLMPPRCKNPGNPSANDPGYLHFVEPYFGGGSVLLANEPEGISEVANDTNGDLMNFWLVLQNTQYFDAFKRFLDATPFSEEVWGQAECGSFFVPFFDGYYGAINLSRAVSFFIRCRQSLAGRQDTFASISRARTRRGMNEQASAWISSVEGLPQVHGRFKRVLVLNRPALDVIRSEDGDRTLFYLDPTYMHETRITKTEYGEHEMTEKDHADLLNKLISVKHSGGSLRGRFMLSGYHSDLYDAYAKRFGWTCHEFILPNNAAGGAEKRRMTECVWTNY